MASIVEAAKEQKSFASFLQKRSPFSTMALFCRANLHPRLGRSFNCVTNSRIAWFSSGSEKKRRLAI
jgi:hypothetical protein